MANPIPRLTISDLTRFWEKVDRSGEHWLWTATTYPNGYGRFSIGGRTGHEYLVHRIAWFIYYDEQPLAHVLHRCDTPLCIRRQHLFLGTQQANVTDMIDKGRANFSGPATLTPDQVQEIRIRYATGELQRKLAVQFGVQQPAISRIVNYRTWRRA